jgi:prevent-host-death family protein
MINLRKMQKIVNVTQARNNMTALTDVKAGEPIVLVKNGRPASIILNYEEWEKFQAKEQERRAKRTEALKDFFLKRQKMTPQAALLLRDKGIDPQKVKDEEVLELLYEEN